MLQDRPYRVYIAGPIQGSGDMVTNQERALYVASKLRAEGVVVFVPHLFLDWQRFRRRDPIAGLMEEMTDSEYFQMMDDQWLSLCDAVAVIPGVSPGTEHEKALAASIGIPIFEQADDGAASGAWDVGVTKLLAAIKSGKLYRRDTDADTYLQLSQYKRQNQELSRRIDALSRRRTLRNYQEKVHEWLKKQPFAQPKVDPVDPLLGIQEEAGELCHAFLKGKQGIRYTPEQVISKKKDAIGDILVYMAGYCIAEGFQLEECFDIAMNEIAGRDWTKFPMSGKGPVSNVTITLGANPPGRAMDDDDGEPTPYDIASAASAAARLERA